MNKGELCALRDSVLFHGDLMVEIMHWCPLADQGRIRTVCSAVSELEIEVPLNYAAEHQFKQKFPYAHEVLHPDIKGWFDLYMCFKKEMDELATLTFKTNTRLAKAQRALQIQHTKLFSLVGEDMLQMNVLFKNGFMRMIGMNEDFELKESIGACKYNHNLEQCIDVLDDTVETDTVYLTHICERPLSSFHGIVEVFRFLETKKTGFFTIGFVILPLFNKQYPLECRIPWCQDWTEWDNYVITI